MFLRKSKGSALSLSDYRPLDDPFGLPLLFVGPCPKWIPSTAFPLWNDFVYERAETSFTTWGRSASITV